jgi:glutaredoxin
MKNKLKVIVLENCPYSISASELLTNYKIKFDKIMVNNNNKHKYKTDKISTFPQIYMINQDKEEILLGGYSDIEEIINIINSNTNINAIKKEIKTKYSYINNKQILRIIEIFTPLKM